MLDLTGLLSFTGLVMCAAGAVGLYYIRESRKEKRRGEASKDTPVEEDPDQRTSSDVLHSFDRYTDKSTLEESVAEAEENEVLGFELNGDCENNMLTRLKELVCEVFKKSERKSKGFERKRQAYIVLKKKYADMKELVKQKDELLKGFERKRLAHIVLREKYDEIKKLIKQKGELLKVFAQKRHAHIVLREKHDEMKELLKQKDELLKDHESSLTKLEDRRKLLEQLLTEVLRESELKSKKLERMEEDYDDLWSRYKESSSSLAEAKKRAQSALESNAHLEDENSILSDQVQTLQASVLKLEERLYDTHKTKKEHEREQQDHSPCSPSLKSRT